MATILVVDDLPENREYLVTLLAYREHRLLEAADGAEALAITRGEHPDLIIADVLMPTMDGYELVRQLRGDPAIAETPVIFWTAHYHEREALALARACGVSMIITKPSEPEMVLNVVEAALGLASPAASLPATEEYDREHLRLLTDKVSEKADALKATNERLSALVELNLQLASELDPYRLLQSFGQAARRIIGARFSTIGILDESGTRFQYWSTSGMDAETAAYLGSPDCQAAALRTILTDGRCVRLHNPSGDPAEFGVAQSHPPIHSWLGAPIASPTRIYGYIGLSERIGLEEFSQEDERLAGILAAQVGRIYQNCSMHSEQLARAADLEREITARAQTEKALGERLRQGLLIGEVSASLTASDTLRGMLQLCAEALVRHLDAPFARIWTFNEAENVLELQASAGIHTHIDGSHCRIPFGESKIGRIARERTPLLTNDLSTHSTVDDKEWAKREGMVAFAGYPLIVGDRLLGVVGVFASRPLNAGTVDAIGSVAHEIALGIERHHSDKALREREEHIRLLLDSTAEAIYGTDLQGCCTFANPACARLLGYANPSQLVGRNMHDLIHQSRGDGTSLPAEASHVDDEVLWRTDGSSFPAEYWSYPVCRDGIVVGWVVTFLDITERRRLEEQFRQSRERLREVVVSSPAVLFTLAIAPDRLLGITWISDNLVEVVGHSPDVARGSDWWLSNVHPEDVERVWSQTHSELVARGHCTHEYRFRRGNGTYGWIRSDLRLMRGQTGLPTEAVGAFVDITERKRGEEEQSILREQLQQAQKLESVGRLAGGVAHDFNNLLTVINCYAEMVTMRLNPDDPIHENVTEILKAGQQAAKLTRQLLLLSRKQITQPGKVNLNDIVAEVEKLLARVIGEDIQLEFDLSPSLGCVLADPGQLHQILMNLAVNARDAMPGGGTLRVETNNVDLEANYAKHAEVKPGPYVQLKVSDTGIGMTKDVMTHVFEPFFTTKEPGEGTGLGLATVYGIVKQCDGSIQVHSEPGEGATFTIHLPHIGGGVNVGQDPDPALASVRGTETILVVEDQDQLRRLAARVLRSYGYRVLEAANPGEALLHSERYAGLIHLMLTDVVMPGMTGPELADRIRPLRPAMEVTFMSGYSERAITDRMQLTGSYLEKPFSPDALAAKVREVLGSPRSAGTILVVDDDPAIRKILRKVLSGVSYSILEAVGGKEAVQKLETCEVDLVIVDLAASEQEGIKTIRVLRQARPQLKIIAMSGQFAGAPPYSAERLGAQASLAKPVRPDELMDAVARVIVVREKFV